MDNSTMIQVEVEVCLSSSSTARPSDIRDRAVVILEKHFRGGSYSPGPITHILKSDTEYLVKHVHHARICEIVSPNVVASSSSSGTAQPRTAASSSSASSSAASSAAMSVYLPSVSSWNSTLLVHVYQLNEDGPSNESANEGGGGGDSAGGGGGGGGETDVVSQYTQWNLPASEFEGVWEALIYDDDGEADEDEKEEIIAAVTGSSSSNGSGHEALAAVKRARSLESTTTTNTTTETDHLSSSSAAAAATTKTAAAGSSESLSGSRLKPALLQYAASALLFSDAGVDTSLISWNHVILLHGPPGTGKTSLCKALAHKLAIRLTDRYPSAQLIEINAHSLFSRWFSESGKLVHRLFAHIGELVADEDSLVFLLIDEVESLTSARKAAVSGSEPSDAVRVVNAVLTAIDSFRTKRNVLLLTTSNVSEAIDVAFVDRADIKALVGPPGAIARYDILSSCVNELVRVGLVSLGGMNSNTTAGSNKGAGGVPTSVTGVTGTSSSSSPSYKLATAFEARAASRRTRSLSKVDMNIDATSAVPSAVSNEATSSSSSSAQQLVDTAASAILWKAAVAADGFSGRTLRKLPLQAHAMYVRSRVVSGVEFTTALMRGVVSERAARSGFADA